MKKSLKSKCLCFLLLMSSVPMSIMASAQNQRVSLEFKKAPLVKVLEEIGRQSTMPVVYNVEDVNNFRNVTITAKDEAVSKILNRTNGTSVSYSIANGHIVLSKAGQNSAPAQQKAVNVTVKESLLMPTVKPLIGVSILVKGTSNGTVTDIDGNFSIEAAKGATLEISYIGYTTQSIVVSGNVH